jgi:hypothetical protein
MRRVMDNNRKRARFHLADEIHERFETMANQKGSVVTSGMNIQSSAVTVQTRPEGLKDPAAQQAGAEPSAQVSRIGSKFASDAYRVSKSPLAVDSGMGAGMATDANPAAVDDMELSREVKRPCYTQITGKGAGATTNERGTAKDAVIPDSPAVREQMAGQKNSKTYDENGKAFKTFPNLDPDCAN